MPVELEKITDNKYQKVSGSREIGKHLSFTDNNSHSFKVFINGIKQIINN